ncbi:FAD-dependent oxidoreductase [Legionella dresdenensis]|uniref:FAD-dependent oxidoreductase n=1 Tax=Legionella dresdenensis TaxID=450200 RepID=A0ABV8CD81_9GAMM
MKQPFDCLIIGGGIVGLCTAIAMAERKQTVALIDAGSLTTDTSKQDARVYAINKASEYLLNQLQVWPLIKPERISPYRHMHVWDAVSKGCIDFDAREIADSKLGVILEESILKEALLNRLADFPNIQCFAGSPVTQLDCRGEIALAGSAKQQWQGRLVLIADGGESPARKRLNVGITSWPYHQHALVATIRTEKPHQYTAWQVFNPDGPLAFLPLPDEHYCSIVWSTTPAKAQKLVDVEEQKFNEQLASAFSHRLGQVEVAGKRYQFPLTMRHAKQYAGKNWLLLGDAAHTIHPLAGLGLNLGLADVAAWLDCFDRAANPFAAKTLGRYQRQRKQAVWQAIWLMEGLKMLFANPLPPVTALRGLGINLCNSLSPIKRLFIEHAAGG